MLYVAEMVRDSRCLLYLLTSERPKNLRLPDVTFNKIEFDPTFDFGKYLMVFSKLWRLQYVGVAIN